MKPKVLIGFLACVLILSSCGNSDTYNNDSKSGFNLFGKDKAETDDFGVNVNENKNEADNFEKNVSEKKMLDPFENLEVQFDGISPYVNIVINNSKCDSDIQQNVTFSVEEGKRYANGDSVKVTAGLNPENQSALDFELSKTEMEYTVSDMPEYVTDFSEIDCSVLDNEIQQYMDSHYMFSNHNDTVMVNGSANGDYYNSIMGTKLENFVSSFYLEKFKNSKVVSHYQAILKPNLINQCSIDNNAGNKNETNTYNYYYAKYVNNYAIRGRYDASIDKHYDYNEAPQYNTEMIIFIELTNVISYPDGTLKYNVNLNHGAYIADETGYFECISSKGDKYNVSEIKSKK